MKEKQKMSDTISLLNCLGKSLCMSWSHLDLRLTILILLNVDTHVTRWAEQFRTYVVPSWVLLFAATYVLSHFLMLLACFNRNQWCILYIEPTNAQPSSLPEALGCSAMKLSWLLWSWQNTRQHRLDKGKCCSEWVTHPNCISCIAAAFSFILRFGWRSLPVLNNVNSTTLFVSSLFRFE